MCAVWLRVCSLRFFPESVCLHEHVALFSHACVHMLQTLQDSSWAAECCSHFLSKVGQKKKESHGWMQRKRGKMEFCMCCRTKKQLKAVIVLACFHVPLSLLSPSVHLSLLFSLSFQPECNALLLLIPFFRLDRLRNKHASSTCPSAGERKYVGRVFFSLCVFIPCQFSTELSTRMRTGT